MTLENTLYAVFGAGPLDSDREEWGVLEYHPDPRSMGYATTLTPGVVRQAAAREIDLLVTHHNAWDFMLEAQAEAHRLLKVHGISHLWCHHPLDYADFGTSAALLESVGCKLTAVFAEGFGRVGEIDLPIDLPAAIQIFQRELGEDPCRVHDGSRMITRIAAVTGAGAMTSYLSEALAFDVDLYVTGETSLYLLDYACYRGVNALVFSHNYTERAGTANLAQKIASHLGIERVVPLDEPHY